MKAFFRFFLVVIAVVVAGFLIGRISAPKTEVVADEQKKEYAAPPTPPKMEVEEKSLVLETPIDGARIDGTSVDVSGRAQAGDKPIHIILRDPMGVVVMETDAVVIVTAGATFGRFQAIISLDPVPTEPLTLEVSREGVTEPPAVRVISFGSHEAVTVLTFFVHEAYAKEGTCEATESVVRVTTIGGGVYRAALDALLLGPTDAERSRGIVTALPKTTMVRAVAADADGVVTADFDAKLFVGANECTRQAMVAQVSNTLRQFPEVRDVVVTVNGVRSNLLQQP